MKQAGDIPALNRALQLPHTEAKYRGYVYLVWSDSGLYKIGRTVNLKQRMAQLSADRVPENLILLYAVETGNHFEAERDLHSKFQDKRIYGEWFDLDRQDVHTILTWMEIYQMRTNVLAKLAMREEVTDENSRLPFIQITLPDGTVCQGYRYGDNGRGQYGQGTTL